MNFSEMEPGDSLSLSYEVWRSLRQNSNASSTLAEKSIGNVLTTQSELRSLVALIWGLPDEGFEHVHITATDAQDTTESNISVSETGVHHFDLPLELARKWSTIASETIDFLGDLEAHYQTRWITEELRQAAKMLRLEN